MRIEYGTFYGFAGPRTQILLGFPWVSSDFRWIDGDGILRQREAVGELTLASGAECAPLGDEYPI